VKVAVVVPLLLSVTVTLLIDRVIAPGFLRELIKAVLLALLPAPNVRPVAAPVASVPSKSAMACVLLLVNTNWLVPDVLDALNFGVGAAVN
jgi:hypothetical protein